MNLFIFSTNLDFIRKAEEAGVDSVIVDWENNNKSQRQKGYDCQINKDTPEDVKYLAKHCSLPITVRINSYHQNSPHEIDLALKNGASVIMLPMAKTSTEVAQFLSLVGSRAQTIIQIETPELVEDINSFSQLSWDYAYIGLNDLMIAYNHTSLWEPLCDGTIENITQILKGKRYGFGGITVLGGGYPIRQTLLLHEYVRLGCSMGLMRRSFFREILDRDLQTEIALIRDFLKASQQRGQAAIDFDQEQLRKALRNE